MSNRNSARSHFISLLPWLVSAMTASAGCAHVEPYPLMLAVSPDNKTVAYFRAAETSPPVNPLHKIQLVDLQTGKTRSVSLPLTFGSHGDHLAWMDDRLLAGDQMILDPLTGKSQSLPIPDYPFDPVFPVVNQGRACLVVPGVPTQVLSGPKWTKVAELGPAIRGAGHGWMVRYDVPANASMVQTSVGLMQINQDNNHWTPVRASLLTVLNGDAQPMLNLSPEQLMDVFPSGLAVGQAQVSPDHRSMLVAPRVQTAFAVSAWSADSFRHYYNRACAVFDVPTGRLLYLVRGPIIAPVTLTDDATYALEEVIPPGPRQPTRADHQIWLTRYDTQGSRRILALPIRPSADGFTTGFTSSTSSDGVFMVIHTYNPVSRLLIVPLKPTVVAAELKTLVIKE